MSLDEANALEEQWCNEHLEDLVGVPKIMEPELDSLVPYRRVCFNHASTSRKVFQMVGKLCIESTSGLCPAYRLGKQLT